MRTAAKAQAAKERAQPLDSTNAKKRKLNSSMTGLVELKAVGTDHAKAALLAYADAERENSTQKEKLTAARTKLKSAADEANEKVKKSVAWSRERIVEE